METNPVTQLTPIDYLVMAVYFAAVLGVGWVLRRLTRTSTDFFLSGRSLPPGSPASPSSPPISARRK